MIIKACRESGQPGGRTERRTEGHKLLQSRIADTDKQFSFQLNNLEACRRGHLPIASVTDIPIGQLSLINVDNALCFFFEHYYTM